MVLNSFKHKLRKLLNDNCYKNAISIAAATSNREAFSDIKNINAGKEVAICGGGLTLTQYKPIDKCLHIALNRALLNKTISYDWFVADDWEGIDFIQDELIAFSGLKFLGHHINLYGDYGRQIPESFSIKCNARRFYTDSYMISNGYESRMVCDIDRMAIGNMANIAMTAMQIALFTNPATIYLVGCDASQGHFIQTSNLTEARIATHEADLAMAVSGKNSRVRDMWDDIKRFAMAFYPDTKIVSVNPVGLKGIFEDIYQNGYQAVSYL